MSDDAKREEGTSDSRHTVLQHVSEITGEAPKVLLPEAEEEQGGTPFIDPKGKSSKLFPRGRGNYQILGEVARGGMGIILKGHDTDLGRDVALKVLDERLAKDPIVLHRFVEEAQIGGQLQHPGVVPVYEMGLMADDRPYFTMKFIKGRTLAALLAKRVNPEEDRRRFLSIFERVCQTVAYAHSKGVIHRDLKPANVMTGAFGEIQVVDWGLAKVLKGGGVADELLAKQGRLSVIETVRSGPGSVGSDSMVGSVMGTPAYMAPEQALGEIDKVDERADVFALGAILCEILTGEPPYVSAEKERTVMLAAHAKLDPARERIEQCSAEEELKELCRLCLAPAPAARLQNAEEVAERIHDYLSGLEERAHQAEIAATEAREQRRRTRLTLVLAATVVVAVVAIGFVLRQADQRAQAARLEALAQTQGALDDAAAKVTGLQDEGRLEEALEVARTAQLVVEADDAADPGMRDRAQRLVELSEARVDEALGRRAVEAKNAALLAECERLRMRQIEANFGFSPRDIDDRLEEAYATAFREYGVDLEDEDLPAALEVLRENAIGVPAALALDDWASLRRKRYAFDSYEVESVLALAFDLDPDPQRSRMREALLVRDQEVLLELAHAPELAEMEPSTFWVLSQGLTQFKLDDEVQRVVSEGVRAHPDDFLLNFRLGEIHAFVNRATAGLYYLTVAHSLRPENAAVLAVMGDCFNYLSHTAEAHEAYAEAVRLNPELTSLHRFSAWYAFLSGRFEVAVEAYEQVLEHYPHDTQWRFERDLARSFAGLLPMSELADRVTAGQSGFAPMMTAWGLVLHPDPKQRDPARALAILGPFDTEMDGGYGRRITAARAHLQLGEPERALSQLDALLFNQHSYNATFVGAQFLLRAWAQHDMGQDGLARKSFLRAEDTLEEHLFNGWEPIRNSPIDGLRREVIEELGELAREDR